MNDALSSRNKLTDKQKKVNFIHKNLRIFFLLCEFKV